MSTFEKKYGLREDAITHQFHKSRRMFCIFNNTLHIADPRVSYSHAIWFERQGWMTATDDSLMNHAVRGFINAAGDVYFFIGYDFAITENSKSLFFQHLPDLTKQLCLQPTARVYGGLIKQTKAGQWPAKKQYGTIR